MSLVAWILMGLVAGFLGSTIINRSGQEWVFDIFLGIVGAVAGGFLFYLIGEQGIAALNLWSLPAATVGSVLLLLAYHATWREGWSRP